MVLYLYPMPYNHKYNVLSVSLNKTVLPLFLYCDRFVMVWTVAFIAGKSIFHCLGCFLNIGFYCTVIDSSFWHNWLNYVVHSHSMFWKKVDLVILKESDVALLQSVCSWCSRLSGRSLMMDSLSYFLFQPV